MKINITDIDDITVCDDCGTVYLIELWDSIGYVRKYNSCPTCKLRKDIIEYNGRIPEKHKP